MISLEKRFRVLANKISHAAGTPWAFCGAVLLVICWFFSRRLFPNDDSWQLAINTTTTVTTFVMVFLIQNTQNRTTKAMHLKLDELIRTVKGARLSLLESEESSEQDLEELQIEFRNLREAWQKTQKPAKE